MGTTSVRVREIVAHYPKPVVLEQNNAVQWALVIGAGLWTIGFLTLAIVGVETDDPEFGRSDQMLMGYLFAAGGLYAFTRSARCLLRPNRLELRADSFALTGAHGGKTYSWADVDNFRVIRQARVDRVAFDVVAPEVGRRYFPFERYGLPYQTMVDLMQTWRERALTDSP
jgi:hypothetical protein